MTEIFVDPDRERFALFKALPREGPVHMLNLLGLKERAVYADGSEISGADAYAAYGRQSAPIFQRFGADRLVGQFRADPDPASPNGW